MSDNGHPVLKAEEQQRTVTFKRNTLLEDMLRTLNGNFAPVEQKLLAEPEALGPDYPVVFTLGALRSGSTLFTQWLAASGLFAYPTNMLSRFYGAPVVGAQIQLLLTDPRYNFRNEILDFNAPLSFSSENGKTRGALAPNEFWYFWRRFLPFHGELDYLPDEELMRVADTRGLVNELTALTRVFGKPFALKSMILNYNVAFLDRLFEKALFIETVRDPVANVASALDARRRQFGTEDEWYSFKIPEYHELKSLSPVEQVAGQVSYVNRAIAAGFERVAEKRKLVVNYEAFCADPRAVFEQIVDRLDCWPVRPVYTGEASFSQTRPDIPRRAEIEWALAKFA